MARRLVGASAVLLVLIGASAVPDVGAHHYARIQPGALLGDTCTLNLIFRDETDLLYAGTASHCVHGVGSRVLLPGVGEFGTVVYDAPFAGLANGDPQLDFALIAIDVDKSGLVDPSIKAWGGPTGIAMDPAPGTPTLHYGQGIVFQSTEATRTRVGIMEYTTDDGVFTGWWHGVFPLLGGDSGSPVLTMDGQGLGFVSTFTPSFSSASQEYALGSGPTFARVLEWLADDGWELEIVTAPAAALADTISDAVAHCIDRPVATITEPDGCYRDTYRIYRSITPSSPTRWWHEDGWQVGMTGDPALCAQLPYNGGIGATTCHESVLVVGGEPALWATTDGGLSLDASWPAEDGHVDVYVYDADNALVAASSTAEPGAATLFVTEPPPGHYRVVFVPSSYLSPGTGGSGINVVARLQLIPTA